MWMVEPTLAEHLHATKEQLKTHGRCTRGPEGDDGFLCIVSAVIAAQTQLGGTLSERNYDAVYGAIAAAVPGIERYRTGYRKDIVNWNEDPNTTDHDVYTAIDKALAELGALA